MRIELLDEAEQDLVDGFAIRIYAILDCRRDPAWTRNRLT